MKTKIPVIIDTDPGIDDAVALAAAVFSDQIQVSLITTVSGNVSIEKVTNNTLKLLQFFRKDIPVASGASRPLLHTTIDASEIHGESGLAGYDFPTPDYKQLLKEPAIVAMYNCLMKTIEKTTIVALGPLTNIALLLRVYPEVQSKIEKIILMGGSLGRGNMGILSEFNISVDPEAASIVFSSNIPLVVAPLDVGNQAQISFEDSKVLQQMNPIGAMIYQLFAHYQSGSLIDGLHIYDACAVAYLLKPHLFTTEYAYTVVETVGRYTSGATLIDLHPEKQLINSLVCTKVNIDEFKQWLFQAIYTCNR